MSDTVSSAELDGQRVELLPARTVLSIFIAQGTDGGTGGNGGNAVGKLGINIFGIPVIPGGGNATGASGATANG